MTGDAWWQTEWAPAWAAIAVAMFSLVLTGLGVFASGRSQRRTQESIERLERLAVAWTSWQARGWSGSIIARNSHRTLRLENTGRDVAEDSIVQIGLSQRSLTELVGDVVPGGEALIDLDALGVSRRENIVVIVTSTRPSVGVVDEVVLVNRPSRPRVAAG